MAGKMALRTITDHRGSLTVLEHFPFEIRRAYFLHGVSEGESRGGHAQKTTDRVIVPVHGSFKVSVRYNSWRDYEMNDPKVGLRVLPKEWLELTDFSQGAVCLVLASREYEEADSVRDFEVFKRLIKSRNFCDCNQGREPCTCERSVA